MVRSNRSCIFEFWSVTPQASMNNEQVKSQFSNPSRMI